eukprot:TRINITY_DN4300_c0_g1_i1.p1 TRINITY_DN4300_c0_g1~~TRINITY_DN4300_c0_g1_i1.p1  ORF type:complete len:397 (-),score=85.11 TRINITY_DN4300_c0_g1_i1:50-1066(-)
MDSLDLRQNLTGVVHTDIPRLRAGGVGAQFWSVYIGCAHQDKDAVRAVMEQIDNVYQTAELYPESFQMALTAQDVESAMAQGKIASLIGIEGGHAIDSSMGALRMFYKLGARYMTLTHTCNTPWADSRPGPPVFGGLSEFGVKVVHEMNRLGMVVDLAHTSQDTMRHGLEVSKAPVILSHNCAYALTSFIGAAPDDVLVALRTNGGILMVIFIEGCLEPQDGIRVTVADIADHVEHIRNVAGVEHVGLGADYDGASTVSFPADMEDVAGYPVLVAELLRRGWTEAEISLVTSGNALRVLREVEQVAAQLQAAGEVAEDAFYDHTDTCRITVSPIPELF